MHLLIDGHNLIGSNLFEDIHLSDEDDEAKLVMRLKLWQSRQRRPGSSMTVIFDRGIPGGIDVKMGGSGVHVVFAADPAQADDLIRRRLRQAKKGLVLVTNDEALIQEAVAVGVRRWRGEEFIQRMRLPALDVPEAGTEEDVQVSKAEVDEWMALFRARHEARKAKLAAKRRAASANGTQKPGAPQAGATSSPAGKTAPKKPLLDHSPKSKPADGMKDGKKTSRQGSRQRQTRLVDRGPDGQEQTQ